jgi:hypothetical protein
MCTKQVVGDGHWYLKAGLVAALLAAPTFAWAQPKSDDEDELSEPAEEGSDSAAQPDPDEPPDTPQASVQTAPPPPPVVPPAAPPSPFTFVLKGMIASTMFLQDVPFGSGNGGGGIFSPSTLITDKWLLGGDIRQSRLTFTMKGPEVLGGATPTGVFEMDLGGGNQVTTVPGANATVTIRDAAGMPLGTGTAPTVTSSAYGDESLIPRIRVAYVELNWGAGSDILRVGQFHNLLLPMIAASASHTGTPLGYGAGQLGWRSPGITYLHRFALSAETNLDIGLQVNRNSWIDNFAPCAAAPAMGPPTGPPTVPNCLPGGVSLGEASMLPQVEARVLLSGGKAPSPWPLYAPNVWQVYLVGHWDQKDLSGVGATAVAPARDGMTTAVGEFGFKLHVGPLLVAANGYAGQNSGNVYGNILQFQLPNMPDVSGFGGWGQIGIELGSNLSLWAFGGMDKVDQAQAQLAGLTRVQNVQLSGMFSYVEGPLILALEYLYIATDSIAVMMPVAPATVGTVTKTTATGSQIALTLAYMF